MPKENISQTVNEHKRTIITDTHSKTIIVKAHKRTTKRSEPKTSRRKNFWLCSNSFPDYNCMYIDPSSCKNLHTFPTEAEAIEHSKTCFEKHKKHKKEFPESSTIMSWNEVKTTFTEGWLECPEFMMNKTKCKNMLNVIYDHQAKKLGL